MKPTPSADRTKLPRLRLMFCDSNREVLYPTSRPGYTTPIIIGEGFSRRSAREKIKREQFFDLPQEEQEERIALAIVNGKRVRHGLPPTNTRVRGPGPDVRHIEARAVLAALTSGSAKQAQGRKGR